MPVIKPGGGEGRRGGTEGSLPSALGPVKIPKLLELTAEGPEGG